MDLRCLAYLALERFRKSRISKKLFYKGVQVQTLQKDFRVHGRVTRAAKQANDGDTTFNIELIGTGESYHCEVTPCAPDSLHQKARSLSVGQRVIVRGEQRFDPGHVGGGHNTKGWMEVHPVTDIIVLGKD